MTSLRMAHIRLSLLCYLATALLLSQHIPWLLFIVGALCGWWRLRVVQGKAKLPKGIWLKLALVLLVIITLFLSQSVDMFGKLVNLVMLGYSLKYIELHRRRDIEAFVLTGFFLLAFNLVFSAQPLAVLLTAIVAFLHLLLLLSLDVSISSLRVKQLALWLLAIAPLTVALFIVTPRLAPLWKMPSPGSAQTGLSDVIRPGDISQLIRSDNLAFRAEFEQERSPHSLYWRAMTLDNFDGDSWSRSNWANQETNLPSKPLREGNHYQLLLEPTSQPWLATLSPSLVRGRAANFYTDLSWQRQDPQANHFPRQILHFTQYSALAAPSLSANQQQHLLRLPNGIPDALSDLSRQFKSAGHTSEQQMQVVKSWFLSQEFTYTLSPPRYPGLTGVEHFLLEQQRGFCVHYAQSVVLLARLMGIPARMVTGYLGGEWEEQQNIVSVRNYDAHAWMEYWNGKQWKHLDPTAWIAPDRVERNLQQSQATAEQWQSISSWRQRLWYSPQLNQLRLWFAQTDYLWAKWILNFNQDQQLALFSKLTQLLPGSSLLQLTSGILLLGLSFSALLLLKPWQWQRPNKVVLALNWQLFILARFRLKRRSGESLAHFSQRVALQAPQRLKPLKQAIDAYNQRHYRQP